MTTILMRKAVEEGTISIQRVVVKRTISRAVGEREVSIWRLVVERTVTE